MIKVTLELAVDADHTVVDPYVIAGRLAELVLHPEPLNIRLADGREFQVSESRVIDVVSRG